MNANIVTIGPVRLSYCHLFTPTAMNAGDEPKYSATLLLPKSDSKSLAAINAAIADATEFGIKSKWNGRKPPVIDSIVKDGDGSRQNGSYYGEECKGHWVIAAKNKKAPVVVDINRQPVINPDEVYSGCYAYVNLTFFPYSSRGHNGVSCSLNHVLKYMDGDRLGGGGVSVDEAFSDIPAPPSGGFDPITGRPL